jgi:hypothetical protein
VQAQSQPEVDEYSRHVEPLKAVWQSILNSKESIAKQKDNQQGVHRTFGTRRIFGFSHSYGSFPFPSLFSPAAQIVKWLLSYSRGLLKKFELQV